MRLRPGLYITREVSACVVTEKSREQPKQRAARIKKREVTSRFGIDIPPAAEKKKKALEGVR